MTIFEVWPGDPDTPDDEDDVVTECSICGTEFTSVHAWEEHLYATFGDSDVPREEEPCDRLKFEHLVQ